MNKKYDYIIIGAGSAGCILADRLTASGEHRVLLLEAGGPDDSLWFKIPVGFAKMYYNPRHNWMFYTEPQTHLNNRKLYAPRGKVQGGSGSINAMIYVRGQAHDFDDWVMQNGAVGWSYKEVLPYFTKIESHYLGASSLHGGKGKIGIQSMRDNAHPICHQYLQACKELGYTEITDFNAPFDQGPGIYDTNTKNGQRSSSSFEYLHPALKRRNLTILHHVMVQSVLIDEHKTATGVHFTHNGSEQQVFCNREIILSAGAVGSPMILERSGIGNPEILKAHGIECIHPLSAVGENLQDHICASFYYKSNIPTLNDQLNSFWGRIKLGIQYLRHRTGALAMSVNQAGGFFKGSDSATKANIQLYFNPLSYQIPKSNRAKLTPEPYSGFLLCFNPCRPTSRGSIHITGKQIDAPPAIAPNFLSTEHDQNEALQGLQLIRKIMSAPSLTQITQEEILPGKQCDTNEQLMDYFRTNSGSIYHLCGTCAMGNNPDKTVVDPQLRVHGVRQLRIVDASVFPNITSGNTQAAAMMVAEKGADMILYGSYR